MRRVLKVLAVILLVALVLNFAAILYFISTRGPKAKAQMALQSTDTVEVTSDQWEIFAPRHTDPEVALILYPGTFVDPQAYAEPAQAIAMEGYLVVIVPMPLGMAVLAPDRAAAVQEAFPDISKWVIGGHSQGGSYATRYVVENLDDVDGLLLWAGRPVGRDDLSGHSLPVLSINGSLDPRRSPERLEEIKTRLPNDAEHINIEGGTHEYFGDYVNSLDEDFTLLAISHDQQTEIIVRESVEFLMLVSTGR